MESSRWTDGLGKSSAPQLTDHNTGTGEFNQMLIMLIPTFGLFPLHVISLQVTLFEFWMLLCKCVTDSRGIIMFIIMFTLCRNELHSVLQSWLLHGKVWYSPKLLWVDAKHFTDRMTFCNSNEMWFKVSSDPQMMVHLSLCSYGI